MRGPRFNKVPLFVAAALVLAGVSACSSSSDPSSTSTSSGSKPEITNVTVGALAIPDAVTLRIAQKDGFFKAQGLNVKIETLQASSFTTPLLLSHQLDFTSENYVGMLAQEEETPALNLQILVDDGEGGPGIAELMVAKGSKITSVSQLKGKKIAVTAAGVGVGPLTIDSLLSAYNLSPTDYTGVAMPFPDMPAALERGEVDAAWVTEPFVTILDMSGAKAIADVYTGALNDFPISCWATTGSFAKEYPNTTAAFQRAMLEAQEKAASDPTLVRSLLPTYIPNLSSKIANVITLETFNTTPSLTRLERVYNVMNEFHTLKSSLDLNSFLSFKS